MSSILILSEGKILYTTPDRRGWTTSQTANVGGDRMNTGADERVEVRATPPSQEGKLFSKFGEPFS